MKHLIIIAISLLSLNLYSIELPTYTCLACTNARYTNADIYVYKDSVKVIEKINDIEKTTMFKIDENNYVIERDDRLIELHRDNHPPRIYGQVLIDPLTAMAIFIECETLKD